MTSSQHPIYFYGGLCLLLGLISGACIGFLFSGGAFTSAGDILQMLGLFLILAPLILLSPATLLRSEQPIAELWVIVPILGLAIVIFSWIAFARTRQLKRHIGTFFGAAVWNFHCGVIIAEGLSA